MKKRLKWSFEISEMTSLPTSYVRNSTFHVGEHCVKI